MTTAREYLRVSLDRSGRERSNAEQADDNRASWPKFTWGDHYSDASSASRYSTRPRDDWPRLVGDLRESRFGADVLVLWESSRGSRQVGEWVELIDLCEARGVNIAVTTHRRTYDPANPRDRRSLIDDANDAEYESAKTSQRVRRDIRAAAQARRPHGKVLFGYRRIRDPRTGALVGQEPEPKQAEIVRRVFADFLAGKSARSIAAALNAEGVKTARDKSWNLTMIHYMLTCRSYLGHRMHNGEDFGQGWKPIIDQETFERAAARKAALSWRKVRNTSSLLAGVVRCSICQAKMQIRHNCGHRYYGCRGHHAFRRADDLDAFVTAAVLDRLERPDVAERMGGREDPRVAEARVTAAALRAELAEAMMLWRAKKLSVQAYSEMEAERLPQIEAAEREARRAMLPIAIDVPAADAVPAWWDGLTDEVRREVIAALIVAVVVQPAGKGRPITDWIAATPIEWRR